MKVILTEKVKALGMIGEIVNVSAGYARNYLFPRKLAILADEKNANIIADKQKALAKKVAAEKAVAEEAKKKIEGITIELIKKVGANGRLFGAVTTQEIAAELELTKSSLYYYFKNKVHGQMIKRTKDYTRSEIWSPQTGVSEWRRMSINCNNTFKVILNKDIIYVEPFIKDKISLLDYLDENIFAFAFYVLYYLIAYIFIRQYSHYKERLEKSELQGTY